MLATVLGTGLQRWTGLALALQGSQHTRGESRKEVIMVTMP